MTRLLRISMLKSLRSARVQTTRAPLAINRNVWRMNSRLNKPMLLGARAMSTGFTEEPFMLADIGEGIAEVEVLQWYVKEGDEISMFDKVCEVQSDKATVDISSKFDGVVSTLHYEVGDMAQVHGPLMTIRVAKDPDAEEAAPEAAPEAAVESSPTTPSGDSHGEPPNVGKALATPAVRRVAREHNIDISTLDGTGKAGRVLKEDVLRAAGAIAPLKVEAPVAQPAQPAQATSEAPHTGRVLVDETVPLRGFNRIMAKTMTDALKIPHFLLCDEVQADAMIGLRQELKPLAEARGIKFTYMPLMFKAASLAMLRYPHVNSSVADDLSSITLRAQHNIGFACATEAGLVVPVVKDCQDKSVFEIAEDINRLIELARANKLSAEDVSGGTFSLSNIGSIGGIYGGPIITPPQVAIGAVGKLRTLPRFRDDGSIYAANIFNISWLGTIGCLMVPQ